MNDVETLRSKRTSASREFEPQGKQYDREEKARAKTANERAGVERVDNRVCSETSEVISTDTAGVGGRMDRRSLRADG